ncbi:hypothetical protein MNBD_ALPHA04-520 [hydrothermal vent metagenome]|uniref:Uncharacterized protein n=1 Tax=hydrothermal vent metagenome TaxID=652676 RepID=A0A3B0S4D2_9ZZZZ
MGKKNYIGAGLIAAVLVIASILLPPSSPGNRVKASPVIPAMLFQSIGEAENQCRIAQESCMINSDRCKANHDNAIRQQNQCKARQDRKYRACYDRVYQTARPSINSSNRQRVVEWKDQYAKRQCRYLKDTSRSCPRPKDSCYSRGYCIQQYQRCSSNAFLKEQSYNQRQTPEPPEPSQQTEQYTPPPAPRTTPKRPPQRVRNKYNYRVTNTCKSPVKAAFATTSRNKNSGITVWGWHIISARADMIVELPGYDLNGFYAYVDNGKIQGWKRKSDIYLSDKPKFSWLFTPGRTPGSFDIKSGKLRKAPFTFVGNRQYIESKTGGPSVPEIRIKNCKKKR